MKQRDIFNTIITGLTFFAVLFGAGNIIFPLQIGVISGSKAWLGVATFLISGIGLPFLGILAAILFSGDYKNFFYRVGKIPGSLLILFCMLALGPAIAIPRLVTLAFEMLEPIFPNMPLVYFSIASLAATFLLSLNKTKIVPLVSYLLAPLVFLVTALFIGIGIITAHPTISEIKPIASTFEIIHEAFTFGYSTLDLIAAFFIGCYIFRNINKIASAKTSSEIEKINKENIVGMYIGLTLLALVTTGLCLIGVWYGSSLPVMPAEQYLNAIMNKLFGNLGVIFTTATVLLACASTIIVLASIVADYLQHEMFNSKIPYSASLAIITIASIFTSLGGLQTLLYYSGPIINHAYPTIITIVLCNILYKRFGFEHIKLPTFIIFATVLMHYIHKIAGL